MKETIIYCLEKDKKPFYIGRTKDINTRFYNHKKTYGSDIQYFELYRCTEKQEYWERHYIELFKSWGFELKNKIISVKKYEESDVTYKEITTEIVHIRIEPELLEFVKRQANLDGRTQSGMINKYLSDQKNRTENKERKDKE